MLSNITTAALERGLSGVYARQVAIADNLANVESAGYRARGVEFEVELRGAVEAERSGRNTSGRGRSLVESVQPQMAERDTPSRRDGNNVSIETELVEMSKSCVQYKMLARLLGKKLRMMSRAIGGGSAQ